VGKKNMNLKLPDASVAAELNQLFNTTIAPTSAIVSVKPDRKIVETPTSKEAWKIEDSEHQYRIKGWGEPYFSINAAGHVTVSPQGDRPVQL
jgi:arginine decarboxylase